MAKTINPLDLDMMGQGIVNAGNINCGYVKVSSSTTIDPSAVKYVSVVVPALTSVTVTLNASKARVGMEVWVKRFDGNSTGNLTIATTSGNVQSTSSGLLSGLLTFLLPTSVSRVGWFWNGTDWEVISST